MRVGSLFSGIGGFDLGLERSGMSVAWQCEIEPYAAAVLRKHWPHVPNHGDVRSIRGDSVEPVDLICGGFPCQPFSSASRGRRKGTSDHRHLWPEMCRVISECRPRWVVGENVTYLDGMALEQVVSDLEALGYEVAPPFEIPACAVGHDHRRARLWICGYANGNGKSVMPFDAEMARLPSDRHDAGVVGVPHGVPGRLDRRRRIALGNALVPQIAEAIGRVIMKIAATTRAA